MDDHELVNCRNCGGGSAYWFDAGGGRFKCPTCNGDPHVEGSAPTDWRDRDRCKFIKVYGPRLAGDAELLARYERDDHEFKEYLGRLAALHAQRSRLA